MKTFELFKGRWHYWTVYYPGSLIRLSSKRGEKNPEDREFPLGKFSFYISFAMVTVFMQTYFKQWWHPKKKNSKEDPPYRCGPEIQPIHSQTQYLSGRYVSWYPHKQEGFNQMRLVSGGVIRYNDTAWWPQPLLNYKVIMWFSQTLVPNLQVCVQQLY